MEISDRETLFNQGGVPLDLEGKAALSCHGLHAQDKAFGSGYGEKCLGRHIGQKGVVFEAEEATDVGIIHGDRKSVV